MMNRAFSVVIMTLLVVAIFIFGMFWSFRAGGMLIALDCDTHQSFYINGKLYVCIPRDKLLKKYLGINPKDFLLQRNI